MEKINKNQAWKHGSSFRLVLHSSTSVCLYQPQERWHLPQLECAGPRENFHGILCANLSRFGAAMAQGVEPQIFLVERQTLVLHQVSSHWDLVQSGVVWHELRRLPKPSQLGEFTRRALAEVVRWNADREASVTA